MFHSGTHLLRLYNSPYRLSSTIEQTKTQCSDTKTNIQFPYRYKYKVVQKSVAVISKEDINNSISLYVTLSSFSFLILQKKVEAENVVSLDEGKHKRS